MVTTPKSRYLVALGSNLGDRLCHLTAAVARIGRELGPVTSRSSVYETAPVGAADRMFLNAALVCECGLEPDAVMAALLAIESGLGRVRAEAWGNRVIDLDLLLWRPLNEENCRAFRGNGVELPHPRMMERDFVLVPAAEAAPDWRVVAGGETLEEARVRRGWTLRRS